MATFYSGTSAYVRMALQITETGTDVNANTSSISWALVAWFVGSNSSQWYSNTSHDISVVINDATVFSRGSGTKVTVSVGTDHASESNPVTIASGTTTITHNSDGAKTISASFSMVYKWDTSKAWSASGTMALTQIARASQPSCITYPNTTEDIGKLGDSIYIHANRASSSFTHTMRYVWGSKSGTIATGVGDNTKWTIPIDFATEIPNQYSGWGTIYCDTYYGNTFIGTKSVAFKASVPSSTAPTVSVSLERPRTTASAVTGYVQGVDQLKVTISATGKYGASITGYSSTVDGTSYSGSTYTTSTLAKSGAIRVTATVTDSRGWQTTVSKDITVQAYAAPTVTGVSAYRCKSASDTSSDASGAYICVKPTGSITPLGSTNGRLCTVYWKKATEASWQSKALSMSAYTLSGYVIVSADTTASYNVFVRLQDSFRQVDHYASDVMSASAFIDILTASESNDAKKGMAIGKTAEVEGTVDLGWDLILRKAAAIYSGSTKYDLVAAAKAAVDSGWVNLSLESGITANSYIGTKVRKIGNIVHIVFGITGATKAFQKLATIPEGYRPTAETNVAARCYNMPITAVSIGTNGNITLLATTSSGTTYDSSAPISFAVTYFV